MKLDDYFLKKSSKFENIDIKLFAIDVEGFECEVIEGA